MTATHDRTLVSFDWAMKHILRDKANFDVLEGFLSALLEEEIRVIALLEREANQDRTTDKFNRVGLLVQDDQEVAFIIEVQYSYASHYLKRLLYGAAKLITEYLEVGDEYSNVKKVISISLLYFLLGEADETNDYVYHGTTQFRGLHSGKSLAVRQDTLQWEQQTATAGRKQRPPLPLAHINAWRVALLRCRRNSLFCQSTANTCFFLRQIGSRYSLESRRRLSDSATLGGW